MFKKATLEFDSREELEQALKSGRYYCCLNKFWTYLRGKVKHEDDLTGEARDAVEEIYEEFNGMLEEHDVEW